MLWDFEKNIERYHEIFKELKEKNYDWGTLVLGIRRVGKSTFSQFLAYKIRESFKDKKPNVYLFLGAVQDISKVLQDRGIEHSIIIFDELGVLAFSRDFMKKEQRNLIKALNVASAYNNFYIGTIQDIQWMDKNLRNLNFWKDAYLLYKRGEALWYSPPVSLRKSERLKSLNNLFFNWSVFSYYYYFLNPNTVRTFVRFFPAWIISYEIPKKFWEDKFIKLWDPNRETFIEISPKEYVEKYRKDLSLILGGESKLYEEIVRLSKKFYRILWIISEGLFNKRRRMSIMIINKIEINQRNKDAPEHSVDVYIKCCSMNANLSKLLGDSEDIKNMKDELLHPKMLNIILEYLDKERYILLSKIEKTHTTKEDKYKKITERITVYDVLLLKELKTPKQSSTTPNNPPQSS